MRENRFFIKSTDLEGLAPVMLQGAPAGASYDRVIEDIERLCGRDAASLFSEPVFPRGGGTPNAVSWYGPREGAVTELLSFDEIARKPALERLQQRIAALRPALDDAKIGPFARAWLQVASAKDVLVVAGEPTLVNWGYVPAAVAASPEALRAHRQQTLGRFAPLVSSLADGGEAEIGAAQALATAVPVLKNASGPRPVPPAWRAPLIASGIAAALLLLFSLPGVLVYPSSADNGARDSFELDRLKASNDSLEAQIDALERAGKDKVCRGPADTTPAPGLPDGAGGAPPRMEIVPRSPENALLPPSAGGEAGTKNVADLLEKSTVLIFGVGAKGNSSQGSGFFISDRQIVTNHHVIEHVDPQLVFVASKLFDGIRRAKVIAKTQPPPVNNDIRPDFAVLEIEPAQGASLLRLGVTPPKLSTAYVAGFPGFLTQHDAAFGDFLAQLEKSLASGKVDESLLAQKTTVPGADMRYGRINNVMTSGASRLQVLIHDMQLAPGNSGGPLVDACGRLGGVNTLLFPSESQGKSGGPQQGNVALDVALLRKFLDEQHIAFTADDSACAPPAPPPPGVPKAPPVDEKK